MKTRNCLLLFCFAFVQTISAQTDSRHIHLIKVLDTYNPDPIMRMAAQSVNHKIDSEVFVIASKLGIDREFIHSYNITGSSFSAEALENTLLVDLSYCRGDIIFFTSLSHGIRPASHSGLYPCLYFGEDQPIYDLNEAFRTIMDMHPSIFISLVNACNKGLAPNQTEPITPSLDESIAVADVQASQRSALRYKELFKQRNGYILRVDLLSAGKGNYSYITPQGGYFFSSFLQHFRTNLQSHKDGTWDAIIIGTERDTEDAVLAEIAKRQRPYCSYSNEIILESAVMAFESRKSRRRQRWSRARKQRYNCRQAKKEHRGHYADIVRDLRQKHNKEMRQARRSGRSRSNIRSLRKQHQSELNHTRNKMREGLRRFRKECG